MAQDRTGVRWGRVIIAGVMTEVCVIIVMVAVMTVHNLMSRGETVAEQGEFAMRVGSFVGPVGGAVLAFLFALWACRSLKAGFILNGILVGLIAALVHLALFLGSRMGYQLIYAIADALKLVAGMAGGYFAQKRFKQTDSQTASDG